MSKQRDPTEELVQVKEVDRQIKYYENLIKITQDRMNIASSWRENTKTSVVGKVNTREFTLVNGIARIQEAQRQIEAYQKFRECVFNKIHKIKDLSSIEILVYRYIDNLEWSDVAKNMRFSIVHCRGYLHQNALKEYSKINYSCSLENMQNELK